MSDPLLTIAEAAERVRLSTWALRRAIDRGELRALKPCGRLRIATADLEAFLTASEIPARCGKMPPPRTSLGAPSRTFRARVRASADDERR